MAAAVAMRKATAAATMQHPARVQILYVANERDIGPARFVEEFMGISPADRPADYKKALSYISYHFRTLEQAGCIKVVDLVRRRGSYEHVHRGTQRAHFSDEEWAKVPQAKRSRITTVAWQGLIARTEAALMADTLDSRDDRWLAWTAARLDERGWAEMATTLAANSAELEQIREESEARLGERDDEGIPATFAMMMFESPPIADP